MNKYFWAVVQSSYSGDVTKFKHYVSVNRGRAEARCGMVSGPEARGWRNRLLKRKCVKCRVSEAADLKRGVV